MGYRGVALRPVGMGTPSLDDCQRNGDPARDAGMYGGNFDFLVNAEGVQCVSCALSICNEAGEYLLVNLRGGWMFPHFQWRPSHLQPARVLYDESLFTIINYMAAQRSSTIYRDFSSNFTWSLKYYTGANED